MSLTAQLNTGCFGPSHLVLLLAVLGTGACMGLCLGVLLSSVALITARIVAFAPSSPACATALVNAFVSDIFCV